MRALSGRDGGYRSAGHQLAPTSPLMAASNGVSIDLDGATGPLSGMLPSLR